MKKIFIAVLVLGSEMHLQAQSTTSPIWEQLNNTAVPFLLIAPDARAGGMGDGGVAVSNDANAMHWNLSNLAFTRHHFGLSISYMPWLRALVPDINLAYISFYARPDSQSVFAASFRYMSYGIITFTGPGGGTLARFKPSEFAFDAGYSRKIGKQLALGLTARFIRSDLTNGISINGQDTKPGIAYAADVSASYHSREFIRNCWIGRFTTGVTLTNLGTKISYSTSVNKQGLPLKLAAGEGLRLEYRMKHTITSQVEISNSGFNQELRQVKLSFGTEYDYAGIFKVRGGYFSEDVSIGGRQYFTVGAGVAYRIFQLDFAYLLPTNAQRSPLENSLWFTLQVNFDRSKGGCRTRQFQS